MGKKRTAGRFLKRPAVTLLSRGYLTKPDAGWPHPKRNGWFLSAAPGKGRPNDLGKDDCTPELCWVPCDQSRTLGNRGRLAPKDFCGFAERHMRRLRSVICGRAGCHRRRYLRWCALRGHGIRYCPFSAFFRLCLLTLKRIKGFRGDRDSLIHGSLRVRDRRQHTDRKKMIRFHDKNPYSFG